MTAQMELSATAINKWVYFCYNYQHNFIDEVWKDTKIMKEHLTEKFREIYSREGSKSVIQSFYLELDTVNRVKLLSWVLENYNSENKLFLTKAM